MKTYHYIVKGRVQGVAFRYYTTSTARGLGLEGTVKNLYNGDVEVYARGSEENLRRFEKFLEDGPPAARVDRVLKEETSLDEAFQGFEIIY
jgi:acylphosphatase